MRVQLAFSILFKQSETMSCPIGPRDAVFKTTPVSTVVVFFLKANSEYVSVRTTILEQFLLDNYLLEPAV